MHVNSVEFNYGGKPWKIETGELAKQANSSVVVTTGDNIVLVNLVCQEKEITDETADADFLPFTVEYREKPYAAGKFPGGFFKREGKMSTDETLVCRLIDRPLRPLFPEGFIHEIQIYATVLSVDDETPPDIIAMIGASAVVALSDIQYEGPMVAARIGMVDGKYVINPTRDQLEKSSLDLVVAINPNGIIMVESGSKELNEETYINALEFAKEQSQIVISSIQELQKKAGVVKKEYPLIKANTSHVQMLSGKYEKSLSEAFYILKKKERNQALDTLQDKILKEVCLDQNGDQKPDAPTVRDIKLAYAEFERDFCRKEALNGKRQDGRSLDDIRPISIKTGILPRVHGSAIFTRGETQALVITTLGTKDDEQFIDSLVQYYKTFMLHYNFPAFSTGEVKPIRGPGRREIGHGALAERAIKNILPDYDSFPYTIRIVSEILESNGSTSMATVCGGSLSLMDAGVPLKKSCAGIAMGLIKTSKGFAVLTDILGSEDALGDMDFKVAGTRDGITALQMDLKTAGIERHVLVEALSKAKKARLFILDKMDSALPKSKEKLSVYAPKLATVKIKSDQIGRLIGPGGKVIREITARTGAEVNIDEQAGKVVISSRDENAILNAKTCVETILNGLKVGSIYNVVVIDVKDFGCLVSVIPSGDEGAVHISEITNGYIKDLRKVVSSGAEFKAKLFMIDDMGRARFSIKKADAELGIQQFKLLEEQNTDTNTKEQKQV
ncbi:MAG: polyribonucleotide nucleotidyltransferase [Planctomycetes bacterium]|nr:polyribonucleotide nucleotidyltransferase [Planctomycetota bacterium]